MAAYHITYSTTEKIETLSFLGKDFLQTWQHQMSGWAIKETQTLSEKVSHYFNLPQMYVISAAQQTIMRCRKF